MSTNETTTAQESGRRTRSPVASDLDSLVANWLTLPEVAEQLGVNVSRVRTMLREGELVAVPWGERAAAHVPAEFLDGGRVVKGLAGTLTVLHDAGYDPVESVRWLFTADDAMAGTPIAALADNRGTKVRRLAQALGF